MEGIGNLPFLLSVESLSKRREKDVNVLRREGEALVVLEVTWKKRERRKKKDD